MEGDKKVHSEYYQSENSLDLNINKKKYQLLLKLINSDFYFVSKSAWEVVNKRKKVCFGHCGVERLEWNEGVSRKGKIICCY